jgi:hypothetical protein
VGARALLRVLLPLGGLGAALWPVRALEVVDLDRNRAVALYPAERFRLRYRHSLYGGAVWEHFRLVGGELVLEALEAEQEAALEYYGLPQRPSRAGELYAVRGLRQRFGELVVRATATGERTLLLDSLTLPLYRDREGHRVRLRAVRAPAAWVGLGAVRTLWEVWKGR